MHKPNGRKEEAAEANITFLVKDQDSNFGWGSRKGDWESYERRINSLIDFFGIMRPVNFQVSLVANNNNTPVVDLCEVGESLSSHLGLCKAFFTRDGVHLQIWLHLELGYNFKFGYIFNYYTSSNLDTPSIGIHLQIWLNLELGCTFKWDTPLIRI